VGRTYHAELPSLFAEGFAVYGPSPHQHPPYSVLDAAGGWWQRRRAYWQALGVTDAGDRPTVISRGPSAASSESGNVEAIPRESQFSPVLTELLVDWYSEPGDLVFDPFCGGPIRGVVATMMGREYHGVDVRVEQIEANRVAYPDLDYIWRVGDARSAVPHRAANLVLTCPPYHNVERYSDQNNDLSAMSWPAFVESHLAAVQSARMILDDGGWAAWVVGDFRAPDGELRRFPDLVASQMSAAGFTIWNRHIVRHPLVTAQMRYGPVWRSSNKATTTHAEVIVGRAT
jgi:hypothetical protein